MQGIRIRRRLVNNVVEGNKPRMEMGERVVYTYTGFRWQGRKYAECRLLTLEDGCFRATRIVF